MTENASSPTVLVTRRLAEGSLDPLHAIGADVQEWSDEDPMPRSAFLSEATQAAGLLIMITERIDQELLDAAAELEVVATFGVGYDHIDVAACTRRGVAVCNTPGVLVETVADLTFGLILAAARRIPAAAEAVKQGQWGAWNPWFMLATDVHHQTLGIIGLGAIGQQVARRARGFDMRVLYTSRRRRPDLEQELGVEHAPFDRLLRESDFVSLHVPLTPETRNLISRPQLEAMKETAFLINTTRGAVVDQDALYEACRAGRIGGAALDVTTPEPLAADHPLLGLPNVVVTPHVGSATLQTRLKMGRLAAEGIAAVLAGRRPPAIVNPEVLS